MQTVSQKTATDSDIIYVMESTQNRYIAIIIVV